VKLPRKFFASTSLLRLGSYLVLASLALMCWGILHPRPLPVIVAMSVGQGIGILGAAIFSFVVLRDLRQVLRSRRSPPPPPSLRPDPAPDGPAKSA